MPKIFISPTYDGPDKADGGIRRVVDAQKRYLPEYGFEIAATAAEADIVAVHAGSWVDVPADMPVVAHCHGLYWEEYEWQRWHYILNKKVIQTLQRADAITSPSNWVAKAIERNFYLPSAVLWHGVDIEDWPAPSKDTNDGYVLWNKARADAVCDPKDVNELAKRAVTTEFVTTFGSLDAPENVRIAPPVSYEESKSLITRAGVYLCTTRETFGIGTLEAMACGVPVLGWDFGGQAEFVKHQRTGYLAKVGDYDDLAQGLAYCMKFRDLLGRNARADVEDNFQWREVMRKYADFYTDTIYKLDAANAYPKTSVIVTNYNLEQYLPKAIESVKAQTTADWELIIVDDASTNPEGRRIAQEAAASDQRIIVIEHEKNAYLAESLNDGIAHSRGKYILPLDADNWLAPEALAILMDRLDSDRDADIAYGAMEVTAELDGTSEISTWPPQEFDFRRQMMHKNQISSTALYRKKVWERVGGYRPRCRTAEDADFWCRATSFGAQPVKATDAVTFHYLDRADSMSHVNADWPWDAWYPWGRRFELTPPGAALKEKDRDGHGVYHAMDPLVSIVIPVGKGHERRVLEALDSIQAQTFPRWECIVVNDTGAELPWVHPWAQVVQPWAFPVSTGPAHARNYGMRSVAASSKYFIFLDADDYLEPETLEKMWRFAQKLTKKDFVYTDWIIDEERRMVQSKEWKPEDLLRQLEYPVTALYPMSAWKASGGFDEEYDVAWEDWDFALRIANAGYCGVRLAEALLHYRMSAGARREAGFAQRDELKKLVYRKWSDYIEGQKTLMACGSCGQRTATTMPAAMTSAYARYGASSSGVTSPVGTPTPDATLLQYIGSDPGPLTFNGSVTGTRYRFGLDSDHNLRYVRSADVPGLLAFSDMFQLADADAPVLVTMGAGAGAGS